MNNVLTKKYSPKLSLIEFLEESQIFVQEYSCPLCEGILNDSVIDKCGHSYCRDCIEILLKESIYCPFTKKEIINKADTNNLKESLKHLSTNIVVNSVIEKQKVYCKNKSENCSWIGKLVDRKSHLLHDCEKELVSCEYSSECKVKVTRDQMAVHMQECSYRIVLCHHCQNYVSFNSVEEHYKSCPKYPLLCPNNCGLSIPSSDLPLHIEFQCDNAVVDCPFSVVGCSYMETRKEVKIHLNDKLEEHLKMISKKIKSLEEVINFQKSQIISLQKENEAIKKDSENTQNIIANNQDDIINSINLLSKSVENMRLYFPIPQSTFIPDFETEGEIFYFDRDTYTLKKMKGYDWQGLATEPLDLNTLSQNLQMSNSNAFSMSTNNFKTLSNTKLVLNMKIKKTISGLIMLGVTFCNQKSPLKNGYYHQTEEDSISYMLFVYNNALYFRGRSVNKEKETDQCSEGDVISLILDIITNTISFKKNGALVVEPLEINLLLKEEYRSNLRIAVDMSDMDQVMFLA